LLIPLIRIQISSISPNIIEVPDDFPTIQEAVDNATAGDTILVHNGTYYEHVWVWKSLTIIGDDPQITIVDGTSNGTVFKLEASQITIAGFTIRNAGKWSAIVSYRETPTNDNHNITNNIITTSDTGISLSLSNRNLIYNNTFYDNPVAAIFLDECDKTNITANKIHNSNYGIRAMYSKNNIMARNIFTDTSYAIRLTLSSTGNVISHNVIDVKYVGIYSSSDSNTVHHNLATNGGTGIYFFNNKNSEIYYNTLINNSFGIRLYMEAPTATSHNITNNKLVNNDWGIHTQDANENTFAGNWLQQNTYGVYLVSSSYNTFYHNNFVDNWIQAYAGLGIGNQWDKNGEGNYWSDYEGEDQDNDGIGDTPHPITPIGQDNYPLMDTWSEHDISIENITLSTNETYPGVTININVTVKNKGKITPPQPETFNVTIRYDLDIIETKQVVDLGQGENATLTFSWNTTETVPGNYTITAEADIIPDELNTDNNILISDPIKIKILGDINGDGEVNLEDLTLLTQAFGSTLTSPIWDPQADLNQDNIISISDLYLLAKNYGKTS
jgi:parallel beta-helix repeat protein